MQQNQPESDSGESQNESKKKKSTLITKLRKWWIESRKESVLADGSSSQVERFIDAAKRWGLERTITPADYAYCLTGEYEGFIRRPVILKKDRRKQKRVPDRINASNLVIKARARFTERMRKDILDVILSGRPGTVALELLEDLAYWEFKLSAAGHLSLTRHLIFHYNQHVQGLSGRARRREDRSKAEKFVPTNPDLPTLESWVRMYCDRPLLGWLYTIHPSLAKERLENFQHGKRAS